MKLLTTHFKKVLVLFFLITFGESCSHQDDLGEHNNSSVNQRLKDTNLELNIKNSLGNISDESCEKVFQIFLQEQLKINENAFKLLRKNNSLDAIFWAAILSKETNLEFDFVLTTINKNIKGPATNSTIDNAIVEVYAMATVSNGFNLNFKEVAIADTPEDIFSIKKYVSLNSLKLEQATEDKMKNFINKISLLYIQPLKVSKIQTLLEEKFNFSKHEFNESIKHISPVTLLFVHLFAEETKEDYRIFFNYIKKFNTMKTQDENETESTRILFDTIIYSKISKTPFRKLFETLNEKGIEQLYDNLSKLNIKKEEYRTFVNQFRSKLNLPPLDLSIRN